jgi:sphinganine-1-phosphate aldolase
MNEIRQISTRLFNQCTSSCDQYFTGCKPWQIVAYSVAAMITLEYLRLSITRVNWKHRIARWIVNFTPLKLYIEHERLKFQKKQEEKNTMDWSKIRQALPDEGVPREELLKEMNEVRTTQWKYSMATGAVYHDRPQLREILARAYETYAPSNPLHPELFPDTKVQEASVVRMIADLYSGNEKTSGQMPSGGTSSILMACLAAIKRGWNLYEIAEPEIIVPTTAHAAFDKAAKYFKAKLIQVPVDPVTKKADPQAMKWAITKNTVLLVGSAPCYGYGVIDPMEEIAELAVPYKGRILVHMDACLGSVLLPFILRKIGKPVGFAQHPAITSISVDTHKYGYGNKGTSVILYKNKDIMEYQYTIFADWVGGLYGTPGIEGSRAGALIATAYYAMLAMGKKGYENAATAILKTTKELTAALRANNDIDVLGEPEVSVVAFTLKDPKLSIYHLKDLLSKKGWYIAELQKPAAVHFCVTLVHADNPEFVGKFMGAINEGIKKLKESTQNSKSASSGSATLYGTMERIPSSLMWLSPYLFDRYVQTYFTTMVQSKPTLVAADRDKQ